jgi:cytochrome c-type biogenesis protein CcmH/NrfG
MASNRHRHDEEPTISQPKALALIVVALLVGFWGGYFYRGQSAMSTVSRGAAPAHDHAREHRHDAVSAGAEHDLQVHLAVLRKEPNNRLALVQVGNIYYDTQRFRQAIEYYQQALQLDPADVNVRTDLGTSFWYSGHPREAIEHFELALKTKPGYPQSLFNLGIVKLHGLNDPEGAVAAWEALLAANPDYSDAPRVRTLLEQTRGMLQVNR